MKTLEEWSQAWDQLESTTNWKKGEILSSVSTSYGDSSLKKFSESKGISYSTARTYVSVFDAYSNCPRGDISWTVARDLAGQPDRLELIQDPSMNSTKARALVKDRKQKTLPEHESTPIEPTEILPPETEGKTAEELESEFRELLETNRAVLEPSVPYDITPDKAVTLAIDSSSGWMEMAVRVSKKDISSNTRAKIRIELQIMRDMIDMIEENL